MSRKCQDIKRKFREFHDNFEDCKDDIEYGDVDISDEFIQRDGILWYITLYTP